jgi:hypothetical protein
MPYWFANTTSVSTLSPVDEVRRERAFRMRVRSLSEGDEMRWDEGRYGQ